VLRRTLGIAGKLIKDMGFDTGNDWDDAMELMLEETEAGGEARSAEDQVISTSLRAIRGPEGHQQSIRNLLRSFALVPEDVKCVERASIRRTIIVVCMAHMYVAGVPRRYLYGCMRPAQATEMRPQRLNCADGPNF
jgi:hypothetical protein